jgi:hypothetical protein
MQEWFFIVNIFKPLFISDLKCGNVALACSHSRPIAEGQSKVSV